MNRLALLILGLIGLLTITPTVHAQARPYLGFVYPAGGQQGTTFQIRVGGQNLDEVDEAIVSGKGVSARIVDYRRKPRSPGACAASGAIERVEGHSAEEEAGGG